MLFIVGGADNRAINLLEHLVLFGRENCDFTIFEGILYADDHDRLFRQIKEMFKGHIFAYYFDLSFEETLKRHEQKPNRHDFGEPEMKRWWRENDYINFIDEKRISKESGIEETVDSIYEDLTDDRCSV